MLKNFKYWINLSLILLVFFNMGFPDGSDSKESACSRRPGFKFLGQKVPLEKGMATHSSILAWRIPWTEEPAKFFYVCVGVYTQAEDQRTDAFKL